jgi:hypothetical protein
MGRLKKSRIDALAADNATAAKIMGMNWPIFRVDEAGGVHEIGELNAIKPRNYFLKSAKPGLQALTDYLPYCLQDQRPSGFLGRSVPRIWPELELPPRVVDWSDDHYLIYLTRRGFDTVSDLIVGHEALDYYLERTRLPMMIEPVDRVNQYPRLADAAIAGPLNGYSVHGEHPKFTTALSTASTAHHVLVKFSPVRSTPVGQRWSDLLLAEHIALRHLTNNGITAAHSNYFQLGDRSYLEVERFDRVGINGRRGVVSLLAIDSARYGLLDRWALSAIRLSNDGVLSAQCVNEIRLLDAFGQLIGNNDRHFGNLALFDRYDGHLTRAPVYDMLPMLFAPAIDQIVERTFTMPHPTSDTLSVWEQARELAQAYWERIHAESRMSADFHVLSEEVLKSFSSRS